MLTPNQLNQSVDPYSGTVNFSFPLVSQKGRNGLDLHLAMAYNSQVLTEATTWNLDAPTGVAGLGWQLERHQIFADLAESGNTEDNNWYIRQGASLNQLILVGITNGIWQFETSGYQFWKISYDPHLERWEIIKENGNTFVFGDLRSQRDTLEYSVALGNWMGSSRQTSAQEQVVSAWNLNQVYNRFGDVITYAYSNVEVATGQANGLSYTQASYLKQITGVAGDRIELSYAPKNPDEYTIPHQDPYPPNAWQDVYETQFLESVALYGSEGSRLYEWQLIYGQSLGTGALTKRLLTSVRKIYPGSRDYLASPLFTYFNSNDGVSASAPYAAPALYGAIKSVSLPEGGVFSYSYGAVKPGFGNRQMAVSAVANEGYTFSKPRFYFGENYTVATWAGVKDGVYNIQVQAFTWSGRWIPKTLESISLSAESDYDQLQVVCETGFFGIFVNNRVQLYHMDSTKLGNWIEPSYDSGSGTVNYFPAAFNSGESVTFSSGNRFVSLLGGTSGKLYYFQWSGTAWVHNDEADLSGGVGTAAYGLAAANNYILAMRSNPGSGKSDLSLSLYQLNALGSWNNVQSFSKSISLENVDGISLVGGPAFAVAQFQSGSGSNFNYETAGFNWNMAFTSLSMQSLNSMAGADSVPALNLRKNLVAYDQWLFRYDGVEWVVTNAATLGGGSDGTLQNMSFGSDKALRTVLNGNNKYVQEALIYNPNLATNPWSVPSGLSVTNDAQGLMVTNLSQSYNYNYIVFNNAVYYQNPDSSWSDTGLALPALTGNDAASVRLLLSGFLLFQQGGDTSAYRLQNGAAATTASVLTGQSIYTPEANLVGETSFVGYTGTFGDGASDITLYRTVAAEVQGEITVHPIASMTVNNQYQQVPTAYLFNLPVAVATAGGYGLNSNKTNVISGSADGSLTPIGKTELEFFNGLTPEELPGYYPSTAGSNIADYYTLAKGTRYKTNAYADGNTTAVSSHTNYWVVYAVALAVNGKGYYQRLAQNNGETDTVPSRMDYQYNTDTGQLVQQTAYNYNSQGDQEQLVTMFRYFWEEYDTSRSLNLLTPQIQVTKKSILNGTPTELANRIVTFREVWGYGSGQWASYIGYRSNTNTPASFDQWASPTTTPPSGWLVFNVINSRNSHGQPTSTQNNRGVTDSMIYDQQQVLPIASVNNGSFEGGEANYYGFQPYETPAGWGWNGGGSLEDFITTSDYFTGIQSLQLPANPNGQAGPVRSFWPEGQDRVYVFSSWVKTPSGFDPANGTAQFTISAYKQSDGSLVSSTSLTIPVTSNEWENIQQVVSLPNIRTAANLPAGEKLYIRIIGYNQNSASFALVDNVQFAPSDAIFSANVYDPASRLITARQDNNAQVSRVNYDRFRRIVAETLPGERIDYLNATSLSRNINASESFNPEFPNSTLQLVTTSQSAFYDFHDASNSDWTYSGTSTDKWAIQNGELQFSGYSTELLPSEAILSLYAFTNFALKVVVTDHQGNVGVGNGEITVYWDEQEDQWVLAKKQSAQGGGYTFATVATSQITGFRPEWVFAVIDGLAFFYADGIQIFAYQLPAEDTSLPDFGKPALLCNQIVAFDDLIVLNNPQMGIAFYDGIGNFLQSLALEGLVIPGSGEDPIYRTINQGVFYNELGKAYVQRMPENPALATSGSNYLLEGSPDQYLMDPEGNAVTKTEYLGGTNGYGYSEMTFEPSPLNRELTKVLPRESDQDAAHFTFSYAYGAATTAICTGILPDAAVGNYYMVHQTDPQGMESFVVTDQQGNKILQRQVKGGTLQSIATTYDSNNNVLQVKTPNYFDPPNGSMANNWLETMTYTFDNLLSERTSPDTGTTKMLYDDLMRQRFEMDANGAAQSPQQIKYTKYDNLGRIVERGYIQDASFQWGSDGAVLQAKANDQNWPDMNTVSGKWEKRVYFDLDTSDTAAPISTNLLGRVWKVEFNNNASASTPDYQVSTYDERGFIEKLETLVLASGSDPYFCSYTYNNQGNPTSVIYPAMAAEEASALKVGYFYNRLGQLASVGVPLTGNEVIDPSNPATAQESAYAAYYYNPGGSIYQEELNNNQGTGKSILRTMSYNVPGMLTGINDDFFNEKIAYYEEPGYDGVTYYNGSISSLETSYGAETGENQSQYSYLLGYDELSRMTAAQNSLSDGLSYYSGSPADSQVTTYDPNNNILNVSKGITRQAYNYGKANGDAQNNDQLLEVSSTVNNAVDFTGTPQGNMLWPWSWGANNGGLSDSKIVDKDGGGKALKLGGGSLGHFEALSLNSYLAPAATYTLSYDINTLTGFSDGSGTAGWYLILQTASGTSVQKLLQTTTDTANAWVSKSLMIDLPALLSGMGLGKEEVSLNLEFRNYLINNSGNGAGPAVEVTNVSLSSTAAVSTGNYSYDPNGNVLAVPDLSLSDFEYDPLNGLTKSFRIGGSSGNKQSYVYGKSDQRTYSSYQDNSGSNIEDTLYLFGLSDYPLAEKNQTGTSAAVEKQFIFGATGIIAVRMGGKTYFCLSDHEGSNRIMVDEQRNRVSSDDYLPFGDVFRESGTSVNPFLYTSQEREANSGLYNYRARFYHPGIRKFLAPDAGRHDAGSYNYVNNSPFNLTDPDGREPQSGQLQSSWTDMASDFLTSYGLPLAAGAATFYGAQQMAPNNYLQAGRYAAMGGLFMHGAQQANSVLELLGGLAYDIAFGIVSSFTLMPAFQILDATVYFPFSTTILSATAIGSEGLLKSFIRRCWTGEEVSNETMSILAFGPLSNFSVTYWYDFRNSVISYAVFKQTDIRAALNPTVGWNNNQQVEVLYLKFPSGFHPGDLYWWRGWIQPYVGITHGRPNAFISAAARHNHHHWNQYGFGPFVVVAVSNSEDAIKYAERWVIWHLSRARHITAPHNLQQSWSPYTGQGPGMRPAAISEFLTGPLMNGAIPHSGSYFLTIIHSAVEYIKNTTLSLNDAVSNNEDRGL